MSNFKEKYVRNIIKLGNSKAVTFPQEWTEAANLKEKSEITMYPIDAKTMMVVAREEENKKILRIDPFTDQNGWTFKFLNQAIISAFKLNVDEIYIKYNEKTQAELYELLIKLRQEIIAIDFKDISETNEFYISFLLDTSKKNLLDVLKDLAGVFNTIIENITESARKKNETIEIKNYDIILAEIDRKYSLGTRILITGISEYHLSKGYRDLPIKRFLGNRVILLYIRDFINESLRFQNLPTDIIAKYSNVLKEIPHVLYDLINNFDNFEVKTISLFQNRLDTLKETFSKTPYEDTFGLELLVRSIIEYYLTSFNNFFDIGITRMIERMLQLSQ